MVLVAGVAAVAAMVLLGKKSSASEPPPGAAVPPPDVPIPPPPAPPPAPPPEPGDPPQPIWEVLTPGYYMGVVCWSLTEAGKDYGDCVPIAEAIENGWVIYAANGDLVLVGNGDLAFSFGMEVHWVPPVMILVGQTEGVWPDE